MKNIKNYLLLLDLIIVTVTFGILYFFKYSVLFPEGNYSILFIVHISYWLLLSHYYKKYSLAFVSKFKIFLNSLLWSSVLTLFLTASTVALTELWDVSRLFILQITIIPMMVEIMIIGFLRMLLHPKLDHIQDDGYQEIEDTQYLEVRARWVIIGACMLIVFYFLMIKFKTGDFYLYPWSERILLILFASWLASIVLTKKYSIIKTNKIYYQIMELVV